MDLFFDLLADSWPIFLTGFITYFLGVRSKKKEIYNKRKFEIAEEVSTLFYNISTNMENFHWFFTKAFSDINFEKAMEHFHTTNRNAYEDIINNINKTYDNVGLLRSKLPLALIYFNRTLYNEICNYINCVTFETKKGSLGTDTFFLTDFFINLLDDKKIQIRKKHHDKILVLFSKMG